MESGELETTMRDQGGVVSRRQVLRAGGDDNLIECRLRRREWARVHPGVYVDHTGPLTWAQRAWAAVLYYWPAALCHDSALRLHGSGPPTTDDDADVHVAIDATRRQRRRPGVRLHRMTGLATHVQANRAPPRTTLEVSVLDVASAAAGDDAAVAVLADACQSRRTTPERLRRALAARPRLPRRHLLLEILDDVATGAFSALERRYLCRVERPHALPRAVRQRRADAGRRVGYRDVEYAEHGVVVELDGRLGHEWSADRWADMERDLAAVAAGTVTLRVGWRQVMDPCRLAATVARVLVARGWRGRPTRCGPSCTVPSPR